jgi:hypothetical protein
MAEPEMIERVARAISPLVSECAGATCVFTPLPECLCGRIARAAIEAMREPSFKMLNAAKPPGDEEGLTSPWRAYAEEDWMRMIDAALEG